MDWSDLKEYLLIVFISAVCWFSGIAIAGLFNLPIYGSGFMAAVAAMLIIVNLKG